MSSTSMTKLHHKLVAVTEERDRLAAELQKLREQEPLTWGTSGELMDILKNPIYSSPVPAVAAPAVPSGWNIRRDGDVLIVQHPDTGGCSVQKEPDWERMIPEAILYSLADALLQSAEGYSSQAQNEVRHD